MVLKQAYLGQPGALSSFLRLCSPLASLQDAPCPHHLASASLSSHSL